MSAYNHIQSHTPIISAYQLLCADSLSLQKLTIAHRALVENQPGTPVRDTPFFTTVVVVVFFYLNCFLDFQAASTAQAAAVAVMMIELAVPIEGNHFNKQKDTVCMISLVHAALVT